MRETIAVEDAASGLRAFIAIDRLRSGVAAGGVRRVRYPDADHARADAARLAAAMTRKCVLADLPAGGAKTSILDHPRLDVDRAYRVLGDAIEQLGGRYLCGPDVGTGAREMDLLRRRTRFANDAANDPSRSTAAGVLAGIRGTLRAIDASGDVRGRRFAVQGLGQVGGAVAIELARGGAIVRGSDVDRAACARAAAEGVEIVPPGEVIEATCDVLVPCALGGVLTRASIARLRCGAVCGAANNVLDDTEVDPSELAAILHARGVVFAPDFVVNAGAVIEGVLAMVHGRSAAVVVEIAARIARIEHVVHDLLRDAAAAGATPLAHALARVDGRDGA